MGVNPLFSVLKASESQSQIIPLEPFNKPAKEMSFIFFFVEVENKSQRDQEQTWDRMGTQADAVRASREVGGLDGSWSWEEVPWHGPLCPMEEEFVLSCKKEGS